LIGWRRGNYPPRIHITNVGSTGAAAIERLGPGGVDGMLDLVRGAVGDRYRVTASARMILATEDDRRGGRSDDGARAREIERALGDDDVAALVTLRGGAWFTRVLERIDFDVLRRRRRSIHIFGFSEMTTLVGIAGRYPRAVGLYDLGPAFLYSGLKRYAAEHGGRLPAGSTVRSVGRQYRSSFAGFFREVADVLDGVGSKRVPTGRLLAGRLLASTRIRIVGGNLSVFVSLIGSRYARAVDTRGKWLAMEDVGESAGAIDRMLATCKLAGLFERVEGVILGDFEDGDEQWSDAVLAMMKHHLPARRRVPIVALRNFGHIWPMAPLPLHREVTLCCRRMTRGKPRVTIDIPWAKWAR